MLNTHFPAAHAFAPLPFAYPLALEETLDRTRTIFETGTSNAAPQAMRTLRDGLQQIRRSCSTASEWRDWTEQASSHPVLAGIREDPFVNRAYSKPRGYAGDAVMLDFIYRHPDAEAAVAAASANGRASLQFSLNTPAPCAVRNRRDLLAAKIDEIAAGRQDAEICSLACGHLREGRRSEALSTGRVRRFLALDQDEESLDVVRLDSGPLGVEAAKGSVATVIGRAGRLGKFDLTYAAGLYDYLDDRVGSRLLQSLFGMLKPGGTTWIANFMPDIEDRAFMEAVMQWWLIYRTPAQMEQLAWTLPQSEVASMRTFVEPANNVVFLEVRKK